MGFVINRNVSSWYLDWLSEMENRRRQPTTNDRF